MFVGCGRADPDLPLPREKLALPLLEDDLPLGL